MAFVYRWCLRVFTLVFRWLTIASAVLVPPPRRTSEPLRVLITGTFYSDQWLVTHLAPLAACERVRSVSMVSSRPVPEMEGVTAIYPAPILLRLFGEVGARSLLFAAIGLTGRYDVLGGFHLLLNGMLATLVGHLTRSWSLYICGGGPREVLGGGYLTENRIYGRLHDADRFIERQLLAIVDRIDVTVCMGDTAVEFFQQRGVRTRLAVIAGGFSPVEFHPGESEPEFDFILIGRLSSVKRVDLFLDAICEVRASRPGVSAVVVGDGPDRESLERHAAESGVTPNVEFAGWQNNIGEWLRRSRVFVLTSESEGLSQALLQALMCGLPAVVSNVGDLKDSVSDGVNGFLVDELSAPVFARRFIELLENDSLYARMRKNALESAERYKSPNVASAWDQLLEEIEEL